MRSFKELKIIFLGTPDFAVATLKKLVEAGANVVAIITAPDKQAGRGMQLQSSAVKQYAAAHNIPLLQPEKLKNLEFLAQLAAYHADIQVVVAFRMLPEAVWNMPPMGTINVHASLLPQYRGAAPINWAIINGETATGVTTFKLQHEIDTGNILLQQKVPILTTDNAGSLHDKLMLAGADLLIRTIESFAAGTLQEILQNNIPPADLKHAPKIFKEDTHINWNMPVATIHNLVRGLSPYPAAYTHLAGKVIKIYQTRALADSMVNAPGTYETDMKTFLRFAATDGWLYIDELQQEGKKKMDIINFLRGFRG